MFRYVYWKRSQKTDKENYFCSVNITSRNIFYFHYSFDIALNRKFHKNDKGWILYEMDVKLLLNISDKKKKKPYRREKEPQIRKENI